MWFGNYEVIERLRVGGMATLYLARRHGAAGFSRLVALKLVHPRLTAQPGYIEMFVDEARICSQISHPNVVHVEEFGVIEELHYLVMEYLDGCSVGELLQRLRHEHRMLDPDLTARIITQIAGGLHAAHETRGPDGEPLDIIHRDISPSNILLSLDGNAKLIDFGVAKARNRLFETQGATLKGKYNYMAPEQAACSSVDRRCDIFSLGVVFWELLVGRPLFPDDTFIGLSNRLHRTEVLAPSVANPWAPAAFDLIVLDMLRHDPAKRLHTAAEVQRRIAAANPGAANGDAAELGALVREVRERCAAELASEGTEVSSSHVSVPPATRSMRPSSVSYRVEIELPPAAEEERGSDVERAAVPRCRTRHRALIVSAGLSVLGVVAGILLEWRDERLMASTRETPSDRHEVELVEAARSADPPTGTMLPPSAAVPPPSAPRLSGETSPLTHKPFDDPDNERSTSFELDPHPPKPDP
ncbi:MAG TPA: serine/threonine-protein kinase [Kofleriaceae bacterium]